MLTIDYIRHTSLEIAPDLCYGQTDIPVSQSFEDEAEAVRKLLHRNRYDAVFTSPLSRARMLCDYCGYGDIAIRDHRIMERDFGEWELKTWTEVNELVRSHFGASEYLDHLGQIVPPKGETVEDLFHRVSDFIRDRGLDRVRRIAVFCHGGVINAARYFYDLVDLDHLFVDIPPYGSITTLEYSFIEEKTISSYIK